MAWEPPDPNTVYAVCDESNRWGILMTYAEMVQDLEEDEVPSDEAGYEALLWALNAYEADR